MQVQHEEEQKKKKPEVQSCVVVTREGGLQTSDPTR